MSDQYEEFSTADGQNITYIQYIHPNEGDAEQINFIIPSNQIFKQENIDSTEICEETLEEYIDVAEENAVEVLESVVNIGKQKSVPVKTEEVTKELIQISDVDKPKGRKRLIADQTRAIRKMRANTNKPYINSKGLEVAPKEFDESFTCSCPKKCTDPKKLSLKIRKQIFNMFWNIGSYEGRCAFINSCVNEAPKKKQYTKNETSRRKNTRRYYLKGIEVCKKTYVKTLQISNSRIDVSLAKMENENFTDERGKKRKSSHGFGEETKEAVIEHIKNNFNSETSLRGLWNNYQSTHDSHVSESYYKRIFYENFNLKIRKISKIKEEFIDEEDSD